MSYVSILKNVPEFLSQPTGIAVLASVGIHGAIAFLLPLVPIESKPKETTSPKTVGLVTLSQAEQNRLPQSVSKPQSTKQPPQAQPPQLPLVSQVPPSLTFGKKPIVLPAQPSEHLVEPPLSSDNLNIVSLPKNQYIRIPQERDLKLESKNLNIKENSIPSLPRVNDKEIPNYREKIALGPSQPLPSNNPSSPPVAGNLPELQAAKIPVDLTANPPAVPSGTTTSPSASQQVQEFVAPIAPTPQVGDKLALADTSLPPWQQQQSIPTPSGSESPSGTSTISKSPTTQQLLAKTTTFSEQFQKVRQQYPNIETKQPISETINTQKPQTGKIEGGLVVDSEGKVETIDFLDNSVSSELKTAAREFFRDYFQKNPVQANGRPKYYPFSLSFNPTNNTTAASDVPKSPSLVPQELPPLQLKKTQPVSNPQGDGKQPVRSPQENLSGKPLPPQWQPVKVNPPSGATSSQATANQQSPPWQPVKVNPPSGATSSQATANQQSPPWQPVKVNPPSGATTQQQVTTTKPIAEQKESQNQQQQPAEQSSQNLVEKLRQIKNSRNQN